MSLADVPTVAAIEKAVFTSPWSPHAFIYDLSRRQDSYYLVARYLPWESRPDRPADSTVVDRSIMGYVGAWFVIDELHIATIAVRPEWRRRGVGELLFQHMLRWAIHRGAVCATLEVRRTNLTAQGLYLKYGFEFVGCRRRYYSDNGEDALLMTAEDIASPAYLALLDEHLAELSARLTQTLTPPPVLEPLAPIMVQD